MKHFLFLLLTIISVCTKSQNVGIGTTFPHASALLHLQMGSEHQKGFLITGDGVYPDATIPNLGFGSRLYFFPARAAFRAGYVSNNEWDNVNVGQGSVALGWDASARGEFSFAAGFTSVASGSASVAIGAYSYANSPYAVAIGYQANATNSWAMAFGTTNHASGIASNAFGYSTTASGDYSTAMGNFVSTSGLSGCFIIGDNSTTSIMPSSVNDGFRARFAGGYRLFSNSAANIGVVLAAGGNSWSAVSDIRLKENFLPVDGESFLSKIAAMPLTTWNYIAQDNKNERHYGPMAQDFYKAFGHDGIGEIGCDTLINQQDFLGVNLIAIQALEKRTTELQQENSQLKNQNERMEKALEAIEEKLKLLTELKTSTGN